MKAETAIVTLADACARGGGSRIVATLELIRIVAFSWLVGDLHAKNLSVFASGGVWQPTPCYDLLTARFTNWPTSTIPAHDGLWLDPWQVGQGPCQSSNVQNRLDDALAIARRVLAAPDALPWTVAWATVRSPS